MSVVHLLGPRIRSLRNRWDHAESSMRWATVFFVFFGLAFWIGLLFLVAWLVGTFHEVEIFGPILTRKLMELLLVGMFALLCFSNTVTALSTFFLSADLELLLSLPLPRWKFYIARFIDTAIQSSWMVVVFGLPVFIAYGVTHESSPLYYAVVAIVLPPFIAIPASIGIVMATMLVSFFPARRVRELLVFAGVLTLAFVVLMLRMVRPERLVDASSFDSLAAYMAELQAPIPLLFPPRWASDVIVASMQGRPVSMLSLGLLVSGAVAAMGVSRWVTSALYDLGRTRSQEAREARLATSGWLDTLLLLVTRPLAAAQQAIIIKDAKTFIRDPGQWSQLLLVGSIVAISLVSVAALPVDVVRGPWMGTFRNVLAFLVLGLVGFVMAALAARFQFTAVSIEGSAFWLVRSSPMTAEQYLWSKVWPTLIPMLIIGEILALSSIAILEAGPFLTGIAAATAGILSLGISGIAVGMGAMFPDFKVDNAARAAAGPAGVLFMVVSLSLVFCVIALEAYPVYLVLASEVKGTALTDRQWSVIVALLLAAIGLCMFALVWPLRRGADKLWRREMPNG